MGNTPDETIGEIEATREDLALKVDMLVDRAKIEAVEISKKVAVAAIALAGLLVVGTIAKRRVRG